MKGKSQQKICCIGQEFLISLGRWAIRRTKTGSLDVAHTDCLESGALSSCFCKVCHPRSNSIIILNLVTRTRESPLSKMLAMPFVCSNCHNSGGQARKNWTSRPDASLATCRGVKRACGATGLVSPCAAGLRPCHHCEYEVMGIASR